MNGTTNTLPLVKSFLVNREAHKIVKIESAKFDIPIQKIVEHKIRRPLSQKEAVELLRDISN